MEDRISAYKYRKALTDLYGTFGVIVSLPLCIWLVFVLFDGDPEGTWWLFFGVTVLVIGATRSFGEFVANTMIKLNGNRFYEPSKMWWEDTQPKQSPKLSEEEKENLRVVVIMFSILFIGLALVVFFLGG